MEPWWFALAREVCCGGNEYAAADRLEQQCVARLKLRMAPKACKHDETLPDAPWVELDGSVVPWTDPVLHKGCSGRGGQLLDADFRLDLLCRAHLLYTRSPKTLSERATPGSVAARGVDRRALCLSPFHDFPERLAWPWPGLEGYLERAEVDLPIVGYGSLMTKPSVGAVGEPEPVLVLSRVERLSTLLHPTPEQSEIGSPTSGHEFEDTRYTVQDAKEEPRHYLNGIGQDFDFRDPADLERFRNREKGYDLVRVEVVSISDILAAPDGRLIPQYRFILMRNPEDWQAEGRLADAAHLPHTVYAHMSLNVDEQAIKAEGFTRLVGDATFLPDGRTLAEYIRAELESSLPAARSN